MARDPEREDFRRRSDALARHRILKELIHDDEVHLSRLSLEGIEAVGAVDGLGLDRGESAGEACPIVNRMASQGGAAAFIKEAAATP